MYSNRIKAIQDWSKKSNGNVYYEHYFEEYTATGEHAPKVFSVSHSFSYVSLLQTVGVCVCFLSLTKQSPIWHINLSNWKLGSS